MKILHLASEYPPAKVYGLGRFVHGLARAQAAAGDEVHVLTNSSGGTEDDVVLDGVHLHRIDFPNPPRPSDGHGEVLQWNHGAISRLLDRLERLAGTDVVASHDWLAASAAREAARILEAPLVVTFHDEVVGKQFGLLGPEAGFVAGLEALTAHDATAVIANSGYIATQVVRHYGVPRARVHAIPGGIDPSVVAVPREDQLSAFRRAMAKPQELLFVYVGRLEPEKGLGLLSEAWPEVVRELPEARLVLAGTGRLESALLTALDCPEVRGTVRCAGYVKGSALAHLYRAADVVLVPSVYEPFGLVALEAMAAGAAVLVAEAGGLAEIVRHGQDGWRVERGDPQALAQGLLELGRDRALREALGAAARTRVAREFGWASIAARTREIYRSVLGRAPALLAASPPPPPGPALLALLHAPAGTRAVELEESLEALCASTPAPEEVRLVVAPELAEAAERIVAGRRGQGRRVTRLDATTLDRALSGSASELVLLLRAGVTPCASAPSWLGGLRWLLEEAEAPAVSPRLLPREQLSDPGRAALEHEPRRASLVQTGCVLARREWLLGQGSTPVALLPDELPCPGAWTHPLEAARPGGFPVSVLVVAYRRLELTREALDAVLAHTPPPYELVLVDNGSCDGTAELFLDLRRSLRGKVAVQIVSNERNLGYPLAINQAAARARGRHLVLLNNDTRLKPGWLEALLAQADPRDQRGRVGIVTGKVLNLDGTVQSAGGILHAPDGSFVIPGQGQDRLSPEVTAPRDLENAGGPLLLLTQELLAELAPGGQVFDPAFTPGYFEDSDLCYRARRAGFRLRYAPQAEVFHHGKATASLVAKEGGFDVWGRCYRENQARFMTRWGPELRTRVPAEPKRPRRQRILLCYDRSETTTAAYCERALRREHEVVTAGRGQALDLGPVRAAELLAGAGGEFDLLLVIEGETYLPERLEEAGCPTALWAIDNHLHARHPGGRHFAWAPRFDHVFVAQEEAVASLRAVGVRASWLPLACDPELHQAPVPPGGRDLPVVFVGHVRQFHGRRRALLDRLARRFPLHERQGVFLADMARLHARAQVVFNCSLSGDLNMRVFEALASGALLVTDRIGNGLERLFGPGEHLLTYEEGDLEEVVAAALKDEPRRREIAARGQALVLGHHTYQARMRQLLSEVEAQPRPRRLALEEAVA